MVKIILWGHLPTIVVFAGKMSVFRREEHHHINHTAVKAEKLQSTAKGAAAEWQAPAVHAQ